MRGTEEGLAILPISIIHAVRHAPKLLLQLAAILKAASTISRPQASVVNTRQCCANREGKMGACQDACTGSRWLSRTAIL